MQGFAVKTERNARRDERSGDTIPEQANVYVPPRPLAALSDHRTMDIKAIRLAAEVDPRQALTELRLEAPLRQRAPRAWLVPVGFAMLAIGFIALWWATPVPSSSSVAVPAPVVAPSPPVVTALPSPVAQHSPFGEPAAVAPPAPSDPAPAPLGVAPRRSAPAAAAPAAPRTTPARKARSAPPPNVAVVDPEPSSLPVESVPHRPKGGRDPWLE